MKNPLPKKRFGQNFLRDKNVIHKILSLLPSEEQNHIIEIGPGQGALTQGLVQRFSSVDIIEIDRDLHQTLLQFYENHSNVTVHLADALRFDFSEIIPQGEKAHVVGNLPYNISTPLLFHLLNYISSIKDITVMLQAEVVDRLSAKPKQEAYGRLSVMIQYFCDVRPAFTVPPEAFYPAPKVMSKVVRLIPHSPVKYHVKDFSRFQDVVREAFNHRRKTLSNSLRNYVTADAFQSAGISPTARPEELSVEDFIRLCDGE